MCELKHINLNIYISTLLYSVKVVEICIITLKFNSLNNILVPEYYKKKF